MTNHSRIQGFLRGLMIAALPLASTATAQSLSADVSQLPLDVGGTQTLNLNAGTTQASQLYLLLGTTSGTAPGQQVGIFQLPLNIDSYFLHTLASANTPPLGNSFGFLSASGSSPGGAATATFTLPAGLGASLVGLTVNHAFIAFTFFTGEMTFASNAVAVSIVASIAPSGMVPVPAGSFVMGDHQGLGKLDEIPLHPVSLDAFYMDVFETTNQAYSDYLNSALTQGLISVGSGGVVFQAGGGQAYCDTTSSNSNSRILWDGVAFSAKSGKLDHPMNQVSWYGTVAFANWRSSQDNLAPCYDLSTWVCDFSATGYRLPTEAEWEYAARGGQSAPYYAYPWGDMIDGSQANYWASGDPFETGGSPQTTPVGYFDGGQTPIGVSMANAYGLFDMSGNVLEWCGDWYDPGYYSFGPSLNPKGPASSPYLHRVFRSGGWASAAVNIRSSYRNNNVPDSRSDSIGFRLAAVSPQ